MKRKKLIYCAHSSNTIKYCKYIVRFVFQKGCLPIDPFETWDYYTHANIYDENERDQVLEDDIRLMLTCDELWVFGNEISDGVKKEIEAMKKAGKPIRYFSWSEIGVKDS